MEDAVIRSLQSAVASLRAEPRSRAAIRAAVDDLRKASRQLEQVALAVERLADAWPAAEA